MTGIEWEGMRTRWQSAGRDVDAQLRLDVAAVRAALQGRRTQAFRRHSRGLMFALAGGALVMALLLAFIAANLDDWRYVLMATALLALSAAEAVVDWRQWQVLSRLDFDRPLLQVRAELDGLRARRLSMTKWIFLAAFPLWLPMILVAMKGLFGVDLLRVIPANVFWINQIATLAFIPVFLAVAHWLMRRYARRPGFQHFLDDLAGGSWRKAREAFDADDRFEDTLQSQGPELALAQRLPAPPPAVLAVPLRALRQRLIATICVFAVCIMGTGLFNAQHGGDWPFLVPGVILHLTLITGMVAAILHLTLLARSDYSLTRDALASQIAGYAALRLRVARGLLVVSPITVLVAAQVVGKAIAGINLMALVPWPAMLVVAAASAIALAWFTRPPFSTRLLRVLDGLTFGAVRANARVVDALSDH